MAEMKAQDSLGIIIQARMGSKRLPGKSLMNVGTKPLINHVVTRALAAAPAATIFLATSHLQEDDILVEYVSYNFDIQIYRGSPLDVRSRFVEISEKFDLETVIRVTADDPFKDPEFIRDSVTEMKAQKAVYFNNYESALFPIGLDVECFTAQALAENMKIDQSAESIEHVTTGLRRDREVKKAYLRGVPELTNIRLTIDYQTDLDYCNKLIEINPEIGNQAFDWATTRSAIVQLQELEGHYKNDN